MFLTAFFLIADRESLSAESIVGESEGDRLQFCAEVQPDTPPTRQIWDARVCESGSVM